MDGRFLEGLFLRKPFPLFLKALLDFILIRDDLNKRPHLKGNISLGEALLMMMSVIFFSVVLATFGFIVWSNFTIAGFILYCTGIFYSFAQVSHILEKWK